MTRTTTPHDDPTGVLLMAYGTPAARHDIEAYYTHVRGGHPPTPELMADLARRYDAIGGTSPLLERTRAQADGLQAALGARAPGRFWVVLGCKHAPPFIEDAIDAVAERGVHRAVGLVLAPHYSSLSVGGYIERVRAAANRQRLAPELAFVDSWHLAPGLIALLAERVSAAVDQLPATATGRVEVLFTAHSLPTRILDAGDPYPTQLRETAAAVASRARGVGHWQVAWQSAGRTPEPWIGPDVLDVIAGLPAEGASAVVVCPAGFVSDHLEVLYDLDVEASRVAAGAGLAFARTASLNDDPRLLATLADEVEAAAERAWP